MNRGTGRETADRKP